MQGHNGKQISAIQMTHSCDTISLFDVRSSAEQNSEKRCVAAACPVESIVTVCLRREEEIMWVCSVRTKKIIENLG